MPAPTASTPYICARCIPATRRLPPYAFFCTRPLVRRLAHVAVKERRETEDAQHTGVAGGENRNGDARDESQSRTAEKERDESKSQPAEKERHPGAMTRRLRSMSEDALTADPRGASKTVSEAGFSEQLKEELAERIASANFRSEHRSAFADVEISSRVGRGSRDIATADPWTGDESLHDANLRMLTDAHKPLRVGGRGGRMPGPSAPLPKRVDTGRRSAKGQGLRLADARDRSGLYSSLKESEIDEQERQKRFQDLKDRFSPHGRAVVPGTIQGLASLANERIEDAIARGQFKNLPSRGKKMERDYNASNPFLDTTEYFLNKMIQKQDIVPPWIEKQQEIVSAATKFRTRLRLDWKRHAARTIASAGGTLQDQIRRAEAYAQAEVIANPPPKKEETLHTVNNTGHPSQIPLDATSSSLPIPTLTSSSPPPAPRPFRDPSWEALETSYHALIIASLNSTTRSYNLQAPDLAKKPYFSLSRELRACYADVAPLLASEIRDRALGPRARGSNAEGGGGGGGGGGKGGGVLEKMMGTPGRVRDEVEGKQYGFRQLWRDVWGG